MKFKHQSTNNLSKPTVFEITTKNFLKFESQTQTKIQKNQSEKSISTNNSKETNIIQIQQCT